MAAWVYLFQKFGLSNPYSTDYWSYPHYHMAAECRIQAFLIIPIPHKLSTYFTKRTDP
jgi:hypothetical protein